jgi:hypothetical protein
VIGTFGERERASAGYRLTPWAGGCATLVASGESALGLLRETVAGLLAAAGLADGVAGLADGRSVAIRGEAAALDDLALALFDDLRDRVEALEIAVAGIEIAGMVRGDDGLIGWGSILLAAGPAVVLAPIRVPRAELAAPPVFALTLTLERLAEP